MPKWYIVIFIDQKLHTLARKERIFNLFLVFLSFVKGMTQWRQKLDFVLLPSSQLSIANYRVHFVSQNSQKFTHLNPNMVKVAGLTASLTDRLVGRWNLEGLFSRFPFPSPWSCLPWRRRIASWHSSCCSLSLQVKSGPQALLLVITIPKTHTDSETSQCTYLDWYSTPDPSTTSSSSLYCQSCVFSND